MFAGAFRLSWVLVAVLIPAWANFATGQTFAEGENFVGKKILTLDKTTFWQGSKLVYTEEWGGIVYEVTKQEGEWLWIRARQGWVKREDVIPFDLDSATELVKRRPAARTFTIRASMWMERKEYDIALRDYDEAIRLKPTDPFVYSNRSLAWRAKGEYDKAIADLNEAIRLNPNYSGAFCHRGLTRNKKGDYRLAIADYKTSIALDETLSSSWNGVAWLWATCPSEEFRDGTRAVEFATRACELTNWKHDSYVGTLSAAYAAAGNFDAAQKWLRKAIEQNPDSHKEIRKKMLAAYAAGKPYIEKPSSELE